MRVSTCLAVALLLVSSSAIAQRNSQFDAAELANTAAVGYIGPAAAPLKFDLPAHSSYAAAGAEKIEGQAFLRQANGNVITCAGNTVFAFPSTAYFNSLPNTVSALLPVDPEILPPDAAQLVRESTCDAQGNFVIRDVSPGLWQVVTSVTWHIRNSLHGGVVKKEVNASPKLGQRVFVTQLAPSADYVNPALKYEMDLTDCRAYADEVSPTSGAAAGAVAGAVLGAALGTFLGDSSDFADAGARGGAVGGASGGAAAGLKNQSSVFYRCMYERGHDVVN